MFALYRRKNKLQKWCFDRAVTLAGVLADTIAEEAKSAKPAPQHTMSWQLGGKALRKAVMQKFGVDGPTADFKLLVDATWGRQDALLLEIQNVYGYSYEEWTPLMFQLSCTANVKKRPGGPKTPVHTIACQRRLRSEFIHEFLYLQCGYVKGRRTWGMMGYTNAVLLWPDAMKHLASRAGFVEGISGSTA